jgi:cyclophilin family peptidyl-prolyl cis-trans isomerase
MKTSDGDITIELYADKSPITVENFLRYADDGHYDGTVFHRVISNFMIQGGGFDAELKEKETRGPIVNESKNKLHNTRGTLAMARTSDPDSAAAQFFINQRSNLRLDWSGGKDGYTVFGEVVDGMQVVDIISLTDTGSAQAQTTRGPTVFQDVPVQPIVILSVTRLTP